MVEEAAVLVVGDEQRRAHALGGREDGGVRVVRGGAGRSSSDVDLAVLSATAYTHIARPRSELSEEDDDSNGGDLCTIYGRYNNGTVSQLEAYRKRYNSKPHN